MGPRTVDAREVHLLHRMRRDARAGRLCRRRVPREQQHARDGFVEAMHRVELAQVGPRGFKDPEHRVLAVLARDVHGCARGLVHGHEAGGCAREDVHSAAVHRRLVAVHKVAHALPRAQAARGAVERAFHAQAALRVRGLVVLPARHGVLC